MLSTISIAVLSALSLVHAAPFTGKPSAGATTISTASTYKSNTTSTTTSTPPASKVKPSTHGATHTVVAGLGSLRFAPENIVAEIGDNIEVHFQPLNHSIAQSSFSSPCTPLLDISHYESGFFSGFMPTNMTEAPNVFTIDVVNKDPIWFYCSQTKGSHCQMGMAGVVNQDFEGEETLKVYKEMAVGTGVSVSPKRVQGGVVALSRNL
ncbi:hypothetical protein E6O75_ATG09631 [Venturia nashicola]|uniref:Extracellular serine-rich protein n=1 Tax=Venturia nashicola TaxID=86259 RepID=A0A4Z1NU22_9PEZI|nr:hypothetical protein E6O75_ATG09631 [Venturia nashicola]